MRFIWALLLIGFSAKAQVEKIANTITPDDLKRHLFTIASTEMQGRETATEGQRSAAAYIEEQFKKRPVETGVAWRLSAKISGFPGFTRESFAFYKW